MNDQHTAGARSPDDHQSQSDKDQLEALLPAFVLGAADPEEAAFVRQHLAEDKEAQNALATYQRIVDALHYSVLPVAPPAALEGMLRRALSTTAMPLASLAPSADIVLPARTEAQTLISGRRFLWQRVAWVTSAAALLLLLVNLWGWSQISALYVENRTQRADIAAQGYLMETQQRQLAEQQAKLEAQQELLGTLRYQEAALEQTIAGQTDLLAQVVAATGEVYAMSAAQSDSMAFATVAWHDQAGVGVLRANNFPALPPDMIYQLWLIKDGERTSGGLFTVNDIGSGSLIFVPPSSLAEFDGMGITPEPAGGSPGPTAPPIVTASLQHG